MDCTQHAVVPRSPADGAGRGGAGRAARIAMTAPPLGALGALALGLPAGGEAVGSDAMQVGLRLRFTKQENFAICIC